VSFELVQKMEGVSLQHSIRAQEQSLKKYAWYPKGVTADMVIKYFMIQ
jgi:hypothetical protein